MIFFLWLPLGPDFGSPPEMMRKKLLDILKESGKTTFIVDSINIVKRYASESSSSVPVSSDDEALSKAMKEVNNLVKPMHAFEVVSIILKVNKCVCF